MFKCQAPQCGQTFKPEMNFDPSRGTYIVECQACHAIHVAIAKEWHPSGAVQLRFALDEKET